MPIATTEEIKQALHEGKPIVALESTIISHGMPYPQNIETAQLVEQKVRENGAIPATIAILNGELKAGLSFDELDYLAQKGTAMLKVSRRDIPYLVAMKKDGATTVASTMIIAEKAGIRVFATGGIGGVHRGAAQSMDISADLQELAQTNVAVVTAGAKSILDIGLTLEYLETQGVPVLGFGTSDFPAFFTRKSGFNVDYRIDSPVDIAALLRSKWSLGLRGGVVIANPIPEAFSIDAAHIETIIQKAIAEAEANGIKGKAITPFLLGRIEQLSAGNSLASNIQLVLNNAALAAQIAVAYHV